MDLTFISATLAAVCRWSIMEGDNMLDILECLQDWITSADGSVHLGLYKLSQIYTGML